MWFIARRAVTIKKNGLVLERWFEIRTPVGDIKTCGSDRICKSSWHDYFWLTIPLYELRFIVNITNRMLQKQKNKDTTIGEVMKLFGIWDLTTQFDFCYRSCLWSTTDISNYLSAPYFGDNVMPYHGFDTLWKCIRFLDQINTNL